MGLNQERSADRGEVADVFAYHAGLDLSVTVDEYCDHTLGWLKALTQLDPQRFGSWQIMNGQSWNSISAEPAEFSRHVLEQLRREVDPRDVFEQPDGANTAELNANSRMAKLGTSLYFAINNASGPTVTVDLGNHSTQGLISIKRLRDVDSAYIDRLVGLVVSYWRPGHVNAWTNWHKKEVRTHLEKTARKMTPFLGWKKWIANMYEFPGLPAGVEQTRLGNGTLLSVSDARTSACDVVQVAKSVEASRFLDGFLESTTFVKQVTADFKGRPSTKLVKFDAVDERNNRLLWVLSLTTALTGAELEALRYEAVRQHRVRGDRSIVWVFNDQKQAAIAQQHLDQLGLGHPVITVTYQPYRRTKSV